MPSRRKHPSQVGPKKKPALCGTSTIVALALTIFVAAAFAHMQAVRTASQQSPTLAHPAGPSTQLDSLRAAFLSESAPAAEPEPTLPPDAAAAAAAATADAAPAAVHAPLSETTNRALAPPNHSPPHYKHRALGEPGTTLDAATDTAAALITAAPPPNPPAAASPLPPSLPAAPAAPGAPETAAAKKKSGGVVVVGDDDGGGPKGLRPGFVGKHDAPRKGKPLALHGPAEGGVLRAEGQAAGPDWLVDPHAATHAAIRAEASGSLLGALRRHHLVHDFVPRAKEWYTNQTCDALLEVFSDVLPRARNVIRTMEYSRGDLKGQVTALEERNRDLDRKTKERYAAAARRLKHGAGSDSAGASSSSFSTSQEHSKKKKHSGSGLTVEVASLLFPEDQDLVSAVATTTAAAASAATIAMASPQRRGLLEDNRFLRRALMRAAAEDDQNAARAATSSSLSRPSPSSRSSSSGGSGSDSSDHDSATTAALVSSQRRALSSAGTPVHDKATSKGPGGGASVSGFKSKDKKRPKDGVKYDASTGLWGVSIDVGKSRYNLGKFKTEAEALEAYERERRAAEKLGFGAAIRDRTNGDCKAKLLQCYYDIHEVMLKTKQLDLTTAAQRAAIATSHDRNRVLERQEDLSPAALKWISAPLAFKQHLARQGQAFSATTRQDLPSSPEQDDSGRSGGGGAGGVDGSSFGSTNAESQIEALGGSATAAGLAALNAANIDFSDFEADALASEDDHAAAAGSGRGEDSTRGSHGLITNPLVLRVMRAWKQQRRRELMAQARALRLSDTEAEDGREGEAEHDSSSRSSSSSTSALSVSAIRAQRQARAASLFSTHKPPCTDRELQVIRQQDRGNGKRRAQPSSKSRICQTPEELKKERDLHGPQHQQKFPDYIHFVHIPKAGGTSFTKVLRRMTCTVNQGTEAELDCCAVGWCDWQKGLVCQNIHGCTNHIPRIDKWLSKPLPSVTIMRDPRTRFVSAWHYRCHHPNYDCFGVRKAFKEVRNGGTKKYTFDEYCAMPEYQNIMVKMLVKDKFPYGNYGVLTERDLEIGKSRLDQFVFVGMNEMYDTSMVLLADVLGIPLVPSDFDKERAANRPKAYHDFMAMLTTNATLQAEIEWANQYDIGLYEHGRAKFCEQLRHSAALVHPMIEAELDKQNVCLDFWDARRDESGGGGLIPTTGDRIWSSIEN